MVAAAVLVQNVTVASAAVAAIVVTAAIVVVAAHVAVAAIVAVAVRVAADAHVAVVALAPPRVPLRPPAPTTPRPPRPQLRSARIRDRWFCVASASAASESGLRTIVNVFAGESDLPCWSPRVGHTEPGFW